MSGSEASQRVAVVTGANRGIGLAIVEALLRRRDYHGVVYITARDQARGLAAVDELRARGLQPRFHQLDVSDASSLRTFRDHLATAHGGLDLLVNNAAVANSVQLFNSYEESAAIIDINYRAMLTVQQLLFPLLRNGARVLNVSSDCGHLSNVRDERWLRRLASDALSQSDIDEFVQWYLDGARDGTFDPSLALADGGTVAAYRVSKVALSALTRLQQRALAPRDISVNCVHPGLVRTDMTLGVGFFSPEQAAATPLWLLLDAPPALQGAYVWFDRRALDWRDHTADYYFKSSTLQPAADT